MACFEKLAIRPSDGLKKEAQLKLQHPSDGSLTASLLGDFSARFLSSALALNRLYEVPSRYVSSSVQCLLWGKAAGRCEFAGCNKPLWKSSVTQEQVNVGQKAHIYAFSGNGPRGHRGVHRRDLNDIQNLILVCHECHQKLDRDSSRNRYRVSLVRQMKAEHERRVEIVTGIAPERRSHVLLYGANVGEHSSPLNYWDAAQALFPLRYPASDTPLELNTVSSAFLDRDHQFWRIEADSLARKFNHRVRERIAAGEVKHLSVFALAPQPLLILLGTLLGDIIPSDIYQRHREPPSWQWPRAQRATQKFGFTEPRDLSGTPALVLSLSGTIRPERIGSVLGPNTSLWTVSISCPNNDFTKCREQLSEIRSLLRMLLDRIKAVHGQGATLHIFPAVSVSVAVELGRVRMPKADMPWHIYDQIEGQGFVHALSIP